MAVELYKYGLTNSLDNVEELLREALNTTNKHKMTTLVAKAAGMVEVINDLILEEGNE